MEVGQYRIGAIIQARLGSTRLPNKVLLPLPFGGEKTILDHVLESLESSRFRIKTILATSTNTINDKLSDFAKNRNVICFRGEEENLLSRFYKAAKQENLDLIIRLTGDNPVVDITYLDKAIEYLSTNNLEYLNTNGLPLGCNFEIMSFNSLTKAFDNAKSTYDKEHVTAYIKRTELKKDTLSFDFKKIVNLRLTIDYPSDYALLNLLFSSINKPSLKDVEIFFESNEWMISVNANNYQKKEFNSLEEEIVEILPVLHKMELHRLIDKINVK
jgi:spore coat polysaccharide biosynthesis protein SpsF